MRLRLLPLVLLLVADGAFASDQQCVMPTEVDKYQLLRRLSLDLRHRLPNYEEYVALDAQSEVPAKVIDDYLASSEFRLVVRRYHESLYWPNVLNAQLAEVDYILRTQGQMPGMMGMGSGQNGVRFIFGAGRSIRYRGGTQVHSCQNKPQTAIQPDYQLGQLPTCEKVVDKGVEYCLDGYVEIKPYWESDPNKKVKLCAFEAQTAETAPQGPNSMASCSAPEGHRAQGCGCGPEARWCWAENVPTLVLTELREQMLLAVDSQTKSGARYSELITSPRIHVNGRTEFFSKWLAPMSSPNKTYNAWHEGDAPVPANPDFNDRNWRVVERSGAHSGILTMPAFSLRFQTNRGRANRARIALTNRYFAPPTGPDTQGCSPDSDNLTERCTCRYCHATLEPLAGYFAPVAEAGSTLVTDRKLFPIDRPECLPKAGKKQIDPYCSRFYDIDPESSHPGRLLTHLIYQEVPEVAQAIEAGPEGLAQRWIADKSFFRGTVEHVFESFVGRPLILDAADPNDETSLRDQLTDELAQKDDFVALVRTIVTLPQYRRIR